MVVLKRLSRYILIFLSAALFSIGKILNSFNVLVIGVFSFWIANVIYCFEDIRKRIYFLMFNVAFFMLLIARPLISMMREEVWWYFSEASENFTLNALMISLVFLFLGHYISDKMSTNKNTISENYFELSQNSKYIQHLRTISLCFFYVSFVFLMATKFESFRFVKSHKYTDLYLPFHSNLPSFFSLFGSMNRYFLCIFLSTFPKKSVSFMPLAMYIFSAVPLFLVGARRDIVLNVIFVFLYYFTRDSLNFYFLKQKAQKWIGKFEWSLMLLCTPAAMFVLGIYNYLRSGIKTNLGIFGTIMDLFYNQGISFDVICIAYETIPKIKYTGFTNYTFGRIIDYFLHSKIAQVLFGGTPLESGQSVDAGLHSNIFAHRLSYTAREQEYLEGNGWGSSFIVEPYADFGYIGIVLISLVIGVFLSRALKNMNKNSLIASIVLVAMSEIYYAPRSSALSWIDFVVYIQFIIPVVLCHSLAKLFMKEYSPKSGILTMQKENN